MRAARYVYRKGRFDSKMLRDAPIVAAIRETYECLQPSLDHISHSTPQVVRDALDNNAFIFSGFKTYHTMRELGLSLTKDDRSIKPFAEFSEEVKAIHDRYNVRYLESEYDHAVGSALMADRWHSSAPKSILEYRTAGDGKVRPAHEALDRTCLPKEDKFWQDYFPPNGWGCRCDAVEVLPETPLSDPRSAWERGDAALRGNKQELFRGNPGRDLRLFPDKHPYYGKRGISHCSIVKHSNGRNEGECEVLKEVEDAKLLFEAQRLAQEKSKKTREQIPMHDGVLHKLRDAPAEAILMLRRSLEDVRVHSYEDLNVQRWVCDYDPKRDYAFDYAGWAPCRRKSDGTRKHQETYYFCYYTLDLYGETYYVHAKRHKRFKAGDVIYTIEKKRPFDLREETPPALPYDENKEE